MKNFWMNLTATMVATLLYSVLLYILVGIAYSIMLLEFSGMLITEWPEVIRLFYGVGVVWMFTSLYSKGAKG